MKLKEFFKNFFQRIKESIGRFLMTFIFSALLFMTFAFQIIFEMNNDELIVPLCMAFGFGAVFSVLFKIADEYSEGINIDKGLQFIIPALASLICFVLTRQNYESLHTVMAYTGIMISFVCFILYILMQGKNQDKVFPKLVSSLIFTTAVCGVLTGGLSACIAAFLTLIFDFNDSYKLFEIVISFVWIICAVNIFIAFIPKKDEEILPSKVFKAFVLFAGLPLYMLLITILLLYLLKIVVTWNMPVGEINWFASFASLFFIFFLLSVRQYEEKCAKLFQKFGGFLLIPVLIMQAIAVTVRINAYGLTTPRTVSLVLIIIAVLFIIASLVAKKYINKVAFISGLIVLFVTVTPFNVIDMPIKSQTNILESTLIKNDMIVDGKVIPNENVSKEDAEKIYSSYQYLKYNADKVPDFIPAEDIAGIKLFGFDRPSPYGEESYDFKYVRFNTKADVDITGYNRMVRVEHGEDILNIEHNGNQYDIDLKNIGAELYENYGDSNSELEIYKVDQNISLYFNQLGIDFEKDEIVYTYFSGYVLFKD